MDLVGRIREGAQDGVARLGPGSYRYPVALRHPTALRSNGTGELASRALVLGGDDYPRAEALDQAQEVAWAPAAIAADRRLGIPRDEQIGLLAGEQAEQLSLSVIGFLEFVDEHVPVSAMVGTGNLGLPREEADYPRGQLAVVSVSRPRPLYLPTKLARSTSSGCPQASARRRSSAGSSPFSEDAITKSLASLRREGDSRVVG